MTQWSDYSTGQRIKMLRAGMTQEQLADAAGVSPATVRKAERSQGGGIGLPSLLKLSAALHADVSVILGQQAPRRSALIGDRAMLRELSRTVHDTAAGVGIPGEPPRTAELASELATAWADYRAGDYTRAGTLAAPAVVQAAALLNAAAEDRRCAAHGLLADAYRLSAYAAQFHGARDLAYAAIGHARHHAERAGDPLRTAMVDCGRSWIYLRDARLDQAAGTAALAYESIEPRYADHDMEQLAAYGWHVTFAAVVASRSGHSDRARDLLSQGRAVAARMGRDVMINGTSYGPTTVTAQAIGIHTVLGEPGKALTLARSLGDLTPLAQAGRNRLALDIALAQADTRQHDAALDTLLDVCSHHPDWARHQALPGAIMQRSGHASTTRVRRLGGILGISLFTR
ncbi:helix-turn-helix transcriptional regulator [Streptacidiphilus sp. PB12-B1b]|uniref:helix-turn-helix transcriptional regulator n=1 Tax=Streptacidiphilus sp. PB12-B1b TaxID=2705012 RepID=UPI0015FB5F14|nr:helix-turn-helix domain-containing protein [Streptacidiphilus sp. PB12-B1b]QMU76052.1 helix-turn-helix transcriptional regulator [Streptacidiphilus sp. PB12-B1b]